MKNVKNLKVYKRCLNLNEKIIMCKEYFRAIINSNEYTECLVAVDLVNAFARKGVLHDPNVTKVLQRQLELIEEYKRKGALIIFIKDTHTLDSVELKRFGGTIHAEKGTIEAELIDEVKPFEHQKNTISIEKNSTSFMEAPVFRKLIKRLSKLKKVSIIGWCTDICDFNGTMGLANYFDQWNRDVEIKVHTDAIATYAEENRQNYVDAAYLLMEQQGIQLVKKKVS